MANVIDIIKCQWYADWFDFMPKAKVDEIIKYECTHPEEFEQIILFRYEEDHFVVQEVYEMKDIPRDTVLMVIKNHRMLLEQHRMSGAHQAKLIDEAVNQWNQEDHPCKIRINKVLTKDCK